MQAQIYKMEVKTSSLKITKIENSKIGQVDFSNLPFGKLFTDHMMFCDYVCLMMSVDDAFVNDVFEAIA